MAVALGQPFLAAGQESGVAGDVRELLAAGRHWKASVELRRAFERDGAGAVAVQDRMALAEAEAGWRNWSGVLAALSPVAESEDDAPLKYWFLLGVALGETGDRDGATTALERFLDQAPPGDPRRGTALSRLARAGAAGRPAAETEAALSRLRSVAPAVADWTALEAARALAEAGRPEATRRVRAHVRDSLVRRRGWSLVVDAWVAAGDTAGALSVLEEIAAADGRPEAQLAARRWRYQLALADTAGALASMAMVVDASTRGREALAAAKALRRHGKDLDAGVLRRIASALAGAGEFGPSVLAWNAAIEAGADLSESERLALARALGGSAALDAAVREYRRLSQSEDPGIAARALSAWAAVRKRQGRHGDARTLEDRLVQRFPSRPEALDVVFFRADDHHDVGRLEDALDGYRRAADMAPSADRAGLARMRWGQIHLGRGELRQALSVFTAYLDDFPSGRRWEEAAFWAARAAAETGDARASEAHAARIRRESPLSYYAFLSEAAPSAERADQVFAAASAIVGEQGAGPWSPSWPEAVDGMASASAEAAPLPAWLAREMDVLAMLEDAGFREGASTRVEAMKAAVEDSDELLFALAAALAEAGRTRDAIGLGWELRGRAGAWNLALLELVFPFPHRELVEARAAELGLDAFLVAGLIRQESAFDADAVSSAGAVGLMQVVPATGRQLAGAAGPPGFDAGHLVVPEVNVHLGALFLSELVDRYDGDLSLALSAYNAGPARANRWRRFPEARDPRRFTERIPFYETRAYVKNVVRNRALYAWLYGGGRGAGAAPG